MEEVFRNEDTIADTGGNFDSDGDSDEEYNPNKDKDEYSDRSFHPNSSNMDNTNEEACKRKNQIREKRKDKIVKKVKKKSKDKGNEPHKEKEIIAMMSMLQKTWQREHLKLIVSVKMKEDIQLTFLPIMP